MFICRRLSVFEQIRLSSALVRFQSSNSHHQIFHNLTNDYHRKRSVRSDLIEKALEHINKNISERLSLLILSSAARYVHHITPIERVELLESVWKIFRERHVSLTSRHYETYLTGLNENGQIFDADLYFHLISNGEIHGTPRLYSLVLHQYCRNGSLDRVESVLKSLQEHQVRLEEDIYSALIVGQIKLKNRDKARNLLQSMKESSVPPTISTYKEILTILITEHDREEFQYYFQQLEASNEDNASISTLYIDPSLIVYLLGQCVSFNEQILFDFLLHRLKQFDYSPIGQSLVNLSVQCLAIGWHQFVVDLFEMRTKIDANDEHASADRHWLFLFDHLIEKNQLDQIEVYLKRMIEKNLLPLDWLLRLFYSKKNFNSHLALRYLEYAWSCSHPIRLNYLYPLFLSAHSSTTNWTNDDRLRLYRLLDQAPIRLEIGVYSRYLQQSFHQFYQKNFSSLFALLNEHELKTALDRFSRLLLNDVRRGSLKSDVIEQIAPYFRLHTRTRQEELARYLFSMITGIVSNDETDETVDPSIDVTSILQFIDSICQSLIKEIPQLKRELFAHLYRFSLQHQRKDLIELFADKRRKETLRLNSTKEDVTPSTGHVLSDELVEQLSSSFSIKSPRQTLENYIKNKSIDAALKHLQHPTMKSDQIDSMLLHQLFNLVTSNLTEQIDRSSLVSSADLQSLVEFYDRHFGLVNLPAELVFRTAQTFLVKDDPSNALKIIFEKINTHLNEQIFHYFLEFLRLNASKLSMEHLNSIANVFLNYRSSEPIRTFWKKFYEILFQRTSGEHLVEFYLKMVKEHSHLPYLPLLELFIRENDLDHLQKIVDVASAHHGNLNVSHDLAFTMIQNGKTKQAERIFQIPWFRVRNDRIHLHSLLLADAKNLSGLIDAIKLTRDIPGADQKPLFIAAIRVAVDLDQTDLVHWLIEEMHEKQIPLDLRHRKFINAHLLSKGLDPLQTDEEKTPITDNDQTTEMSFSGF